MQKNNISFIECLKSVIIGDKSIGKFYVKKHPNSKYSFDDILNEIIYVLKTGISYRDLKSPIKWQSVYFHYQRFVKFDIFKKLFLKLRMIFASKNTLNVQLIDSTFVMNKYGRNKIARNKFYKNKNCNKISIITDIDGIPLSVLVNSGNVHDLSFIQKHVNDLIVINRKRNNNNVILLADKGYESKKVRDTIITNGYTLMIPKKSNMKVVYPFNKQLYKNRIHVEHSFQKFKTFRRIGNRYDNKFKNYLSFVYLATSIIIHKKI